MGYFPIFFYIYPYILEVIKIYHGSEAKKVRKVIDRNRAVKKQLRKSTVYRTFKIMEPYRWVPVCRGSICFLHCMRASHISFSFLQGASRAGGRIPREVFQVLCAFPDLLICKYILVMYLQHILYALDHSLFLFHSLNPPAVGAAESISDNFGHVFSWIYISSSFFFSFSISSWTVV
jgi:hypothetical protein